MAEEVKRAVFSRGQGDRLTVEEKKEERKKETVPMDTYFVIRHPAKGSGLCRGKVPSYDTKTLADTSF